MGLFDRFKNKAVTVSRYQMITDNGGGFYSWNGNLYQSDIVRSAIRPKAKAIGKAIGKHIRQGLDGTKINPDVYMRFLLEEPNPYMTGQQLQEKLITQLELNNNAFAYINRDENGYPTEIYPITALTSEAIQDDAGTLYLRFNLRNGKTVTFRYTDIIHLRKDFNDNEIFGDSPAQALTSLMEIANTTDQGIVKAIKNSNVIKWLLKFNQTLRPEDIKKNTKEFVDSFLNIETTETSGAAATDAKMDAKQVEPKDYVPNENQMDKTVQRIYSFFNTNNKIVQGSYNEDEWISYYESAIEPDIVQMSGEYTRKLFSRRERGFGNKILFESSNLSFASMQTKLNLVQFVDRGIMVPNEVREVLNMAPIEGGDVPIRRLDTAPTTQTAK
ncbi:phage portal protein [Bacillus sp. BP-3]|uniref:phage portal protein n=1 Tax=Bacillus sp. BP-3 TaxID=3022773 RepID=UPI00232C58A2|nr:phage portal protein [Bacillus sp. BP-3]MDC2866521.1 phage portal protein [Bacillus sp. BP-3]